MPLARVQAGRGRRGLAVPAVARRRRQLRDRRQSVDQRRRHRGAALRQRARARARPRSRSRRRPRLGRPARTAQGQHRLRPEAALPRQRRHARHHHRGGAEALSAAAHVGDGMGRASPTSRRRSRLLRAMRAGARRSPDRLRADFARLRRAHARAIPVAARSAARPPLVRRWSRPTTPPPHSPLVGRARGGARRRDRRRHRARRRASRSREAQAAPAVGAARAHSRGAAARRPEHQARHQRAGLAHSRVPGRARRPRSTPRFRACATSSSATWATATCTTIFPRRRASTAGAFHRADARAPIASSTTWSPSSAAASAPSTASAR